MAWAGALLMAGPAQAQSLRGIAEGQYEKLSRFGNGDDVESWVTFFRLDYATRFRNSLELSSQLQFSEQRYTNRSDRARTPLGSIRLAHPLFGLYGSYRPTVVTDSRGLTTRQQQTMLTGYVQKAGLPRLVGSWVRRHLDRSVDFPGSVSVVRELSAAHEVGRFGVHASYGDQTRVADIDQGRRARDDRFNLGTAARFEGRRANASLQYDFGLTRRREGGPSRQSTRVHSAGLGGGLTISPRTSASLAYSYRHSGGGTPGAPALREHNGTLNLVHNLTRALQISGGGGVRSALVSNGNSEVESFVVGSATANAQARPGWTVGAGVSESWNWLPGDRARPVDNFRASTRMRLAEGLEANGDLTLSRTERAVPPSDTLTSATQVSLQSGAGLRATPLRTLTLSASARRYRTGASLRGEEMSSTSYTTGLDWRPSGKFTATTTWSTTSGFVRQGPVSRLMQSMVQWTPGRNVQATGTYARTSQQVRDPNIALAANRESYGAWVALGLTRDLRATIRYSIADPGLPSHAQQVNAAVTRSFGR